MTQTILVTGPERHRRWLDEAKLAILLEAFAPGGSPIEVARRHGISSGLLYTWRKKATASASRPAPADGKPVFLPAIIGDGEAPLLLRRPASAAAAGPTPTIEVHLKGGVKVRIEAGMPQAVIAATLKALR
jgi:transposase